MRQIYALVLFSLLSLCSMQSWASTSITSGHVSGRWTLAGSPYLIYCNIKVDSNMSLTIDPGVELRFQGYYRFDVNGMLHAVGTATAPINFHVQDTTGWSDHTALSGGWQGLYFNYPMYFTIATDTSAFRYCNLYDVKGSGLYPNTSAFYCYRNVNVANCSFYHCWVTDANVIYYTSGGTTPMCFSRNTMHDCDATNSTCFYANNSASYRDSVLLNNFYRNGGLTGTCWLFGNYVFLGNTVHDNNPPFYAPVVVSGNGTTLVTHNTFYGNSSSGTAALEVSNANAIIDANLFYNNQHLSGGRICGFTDGGGGILILNNGAPNPDTLISIIRNNVLVNNYSDWFGGAVSISSATVKLTNNTIANNYAVSGGKALYIAGNNSKVRIQNNIFYGNQYSSNALDSSEVLLLSSTGDTISFDYNYLPKTYSKMVGKQFATTSYTRIDDTIHNVIGNAPQFLAPTTSAGVNAGAATANFSIVAGSPCIDKGDSVHAYRSLLDFASNQRIFSEKIDIGAYEYRMVAPSGVFAIQSSSDRMIVYPIPTTSEVHIILPEGSSGGCLFTVRDMQGRTVLTHEVSNPVRQSMLQISTLPVGTYILDAQSVNHAWSYRTVICKQ